MTKCLQPCYDAGLTTRGVTLPDGSDPDSFVRDEGAEAFCALIERARPLAELVLDRTVAPAVGQSVEERARIAPEVARVLGAVPKGPVRTKYAEDAARRLEFTLDELRTLVSSAKKRQRYPSAASSEVASEAAIDIRPLTETETLWVQLLVDAPQFAGPLLTESENTGLVLPQVINALAGAIQTASFSEESGRIDRVITGMEPALQRPLMGAISKERSFEKADCDRLFEELLWWLRVRSVRQRKRRLFEGMRVAENSGDFTEFAELAKEDRGLTQQLEELMRQQPRGIGALH